MALKVAYAGYRRPTTYATVDEINHLIKIVSRRVMVYILWSSVSESARGCHNFFNLN